MDDSVDIEYTHIREYSSRGLENRLYESAVWNISYRCTAMQHSPKCFPMYTYPTVSLCYCEACSAGFTSWTTVLVSTVGFTSSFGGSGKIFPSAPRGFLVQPVLNKGPSLKRGKGWASVLMTMSVRGKRSFGEKRR